MSTSSLPGQSWSLSQRIGFRFFFLWSLLQFGTVWPLNLVEWLGSFDSLWYRLARPTGLALGFEVLPPDLNGSSDRLFDWICLLIAVSLAALGTAVWSLAQRRVPHHRKLFDLLSLYLTVVLVQVLLSYGSSKLFLLQFPTPGAARLDQRVGDLSPMGLLWTFIGASPPYQFFGGLMEVIAALLLMLPRTRTLGALVALGVLGNVVMMNLCYDVPVKIFSGALLIIALFLIGPSVPRLLGVFIFNRPTVPPELSPRFWADGRWLRFRQLTLVVLLLGPLADLTLDARAQWTQRRARAWGGVYAVTAVEGVVSFDQLTVVRTGVFFRINGVQQFRAFVGDKRPQDGEMLLDALPESSATGGALGDRLFVGALAPTVRFTGTWRGDPVAFEARRDDVSPDLLVSRGFHWVNEVPFNH